jgi:hypothetical protein
VGTPAVQAAGGLIDAFVEFSAEFEHGHHALERGDFQIGVGFHGYPAAVVFDADRAVVVDRHGDFAGKARHHLVDRVVDDLVDQVVKSAGGGIRDVHAGPLADVLQVAEVFEVLGLIFGLTLGFMELIPVQVG